MRTANSLLLILSFAASAALGQEPALDISPVGEIREFFDTNAKVSGTSLVGIELGTPPRMQFNPDDVRVPRPSTGRLICIHAVGRDGIYTARSLYELPDVLRESGELRLAPFSERYGMRLRDYASDAIAITAFPASGTECYDPDPVLLPVLHPGTAPHLRVLVNAGERAASILADGVIVPCNRLPGDVLRIAFDTVCSHEVTLAAEPVEHSYVLLLDDGLGVSEEQFRVFVPALH